MKIGVIGAGAWGKNLVSNFSSMGVLKGIADSVVENRKNAIAIQPDLDVYESHHDLLADGYDAVAIATPAHTHYSIAKEAMKAGCDVFIEKPMTLNSDDAKALVLLGQQLDKVVMVGHLLLYQPAIDFIKEFLDSKKLGILYSMHQRRSKLGRVRSVENVLWSFGVHDIAVLLYLANQEPSSVQVSGHCGVQKNIEDDTYLHMKFPDGSKANLHNSWFWPNVERSLIITGEKGMLLYDELEQNVSLVKKSINSELQNVDFGRDVIFEGSAQPLMIELEHFIMCCKTRSKPKSCGNNGMAVVKVLEKAEGLLKKSR